MPAFDIVVYGATGFTGRRAAAYLDQHGGPDLKLAIAGRNPTTLAKVAATLGREVGQILADSSKPATVDAMVAQARVVCTTAGPYDLYGTPVVDAAVDHGVHYCDITGETHWARKMIDAHHEQAKANGTKIIPFCGFDSVPSDIGARWAVEHAREVLGAEPVTVLGFHSLAGGGLNGGTLASALNLLGSKDGRRMADPVLLSPKAFRTQERREANPDATAPHFDAVRGKWAAPFFMAPVNTRVVRRSNALETESGHGYGDAFRYQEFLNTGKGTAGQLRAWGIAMSMAAFAGASRSSGVRSLIERFGPAPGEGPSEEAIENGYTKIELVVEAANGKTAVLRFGGPGDAGNKNTVRFLCESALALAFDGQALPPCAGVVTPATGLGQVLHDRLQASGMSFEVVQ